FATSSGCRFSGEAEMIRNTFAQRFFSRFSANAGRAKSRNTRRRLSRAIEPLLKPLENRWLLAALDSTDQSDYSFATTAQITGCGCVQGEDVQLQVTQVEGTVGSNDDPQNQPWTITEGGSGDLDGLLDGNFASTWDVTDPDAVGATYLLTATGMTSGETAS